jgi:branched-chain amino acid transport system substrate-binding protein
MTSQLSKRNFIVLCAAAALVSTAFAQGGEPILIGAHLDVAKQASYYSLLQRDAIDAYVKLKNAQGGIKGRPIKVLYEDDELNPNIAAQKVEKLASQGVVAILSISGSTSGLAAQAKGEELKIPVFSGNTAERLSTIPPKRYYFRLAMRDSIAGQAIADFIKQKGGAGAKVAVVRDATETGLLVSEAYIDALKRAGLNVVATEQVTPGSGDVTAQALNVRRSNAEYVLLAGASVPDLANYLKAHKQLGNKAMPLGSFVLAAPSFLGLVGDAGQGFLFPDAVDFNRPEVTAIVNALTPVMGDKARLGFSVQTWELMRMITDALERGGPTREGLRDATEATRNWATAVGTAGTTINFSRDNHDAFTDTKEVVMRQIWDKSYRTYKP